MARYRRNPPGLWCPHAYRHCAPGHILLSHAVNLPGKIQEIMSYPEFLKLMFDCVDECGEAALINTKNGATRRVIVTAQMLEGGGHI